MKLERCEKSERGTRQQPQGCADEQDEKRHPGGGVDLFSGNR